MVEFVVRVPDDTPPGEPVFLSGDGDALGHWRAEGVRLDRWGDGTHRARLDLPAGARYLVTRGRWRAAESDGHGRERSPRELHAVGPTTIEVHVAGWGRDSVRYHHEFGSAFVAHPRTLAVYRPPGYDLFPNQRFPALYLQDGQNLFDADTAFGGVPWRCDETAERLARAGEARPVILVGVANSPDRLREYGPQRCDPDDPARAYGRFLVEEVKPFIDATYRTLPGPADTGIGGSSMGGLIALHLAKWHAGVFGRCLAMSPSLWWDRGYVVRNVTVGVGWLSRCRVWLDMGGREGATRAGMVANVRRARRLARVLKKLGADYRYVEDRGAGHNETAWGRRFADALGFLYPATG